MTVEHWCHGSRCHERDTLDRVRGTKGSKVLRTRKITTNYNEDSPYRRYNYFCSLNCLNDFIEKNLQAMIAIAPRNNPLETPIELVETKVNRQRWDYETKGYIEYQTKEKAIKFKE